MPKRPLIPMTDAQRVELVRRLATVAESQRDLLLLVAQTFLDTGSDPDDIASALSCSRSSLYRRLATWKRDHQDEDA